MIYIWPQMALRKGLHDPQQLGTAGCRMYKSHESVILEKIPYIWSFEIYIYIGCRPSFEVVAVVDFFALLLRFS